ncbi:unnamed protein product [Dibothriocephalus latus]|uniref:SAM domain-containing protein n=1 Tax=Dibothriocephalus latus TaxID=60516 RepID=A0A3P7MEV0_DIBLA|nr:unnamed protein product [Dibothriocephalus latus]
MEFRSLCENPTLNPSTATSSGIFFDNPTPQTFVMNDTHVKSPNGNCLSKSTGPTSATELIKHAFLEAGSVCKSHNSSIIEIDSQVSLPPSFIRSWSAGQVVKWLTECNLSKFNEALEGLDGCLLWELARQRIVAPESFCVQLRSELGMSIIEFLRLSHALSHHSDLHED